MRGGGKPRHVERLLIAHRPQLVEKQISIELRKRKVIEGVLYEFDLWIESEDAGLFLVECKDWKDKYPVGRDVVIVFDEKMQLTNASGGYIVARKFTRYAKARAQRQPRLTLQVMNEDLAGLALISGLHEVQTSLIWEECRIYLNGAHGDPGITGDRDCIYRGEPTTLSRLGPELYKRALTERMSNEPTSTMPEGSYRIDYEVEYDSEDLEIGDFRPASIGVEVAFSVEVMQPKISWHYNFIDRGVTRSYQHETELAETILTRVETDEGLSGTHITLVTRSGSISTFMDLASMFRRSVL
jgi:hypothetical protein